MVGRVILLTVASGSLTTLVATYTIRALEFRLNMCFRVFETATLIAVSSPDVSVRQTAEGGCDE